MRRISVSSGKYFALLDDEDYERAAKHSWQALVDHSPRLSTVYARTSPVLCSREEARLTGKPRRQTLLLHRFILGIDDSRIKVDHVNGDGLDNRRSNIRVATVSQNRQNSRPKNKYKGIHRNWNKWQAVIRVEKQPLYLGNFSSEIEAAQAYDTAATQYFGEFARLNFPLEKT